uniref:NUDE domain-containing protein n=1 Tax=Romanomermis culicivorax TaxID=13658 RepID=A0A915J8Z6_ROMCU
MTDHDARIKKLESEIDHWKSTAASNQRKYESTQEELEEFQSGSREFEKELETQIEQLEKQNRDLKSVNQKLYMENESNRAKLQSFQLENAQQVDRLEIELMKVKQERDEMQRYIRDLEQTNDALESAKRAALVSVEDYERRLNEAIERNAFLEGELDEKDDLQTCVQHLKEETRDLRQELKLKDRLTTAASSNARENIPQRPLSLTLSNKAQNGTIAPPKESMEREKEGQPKRKSDFVTSPSKESTTPSTFTTSTRISALNIVSDLLRKVGALETKLANSKRFSVDSSYTIASPTKTQNPSMTLNNTVTLAASEKD